MLTVNPESVSRSRKAALEIDRFAKLADSVPSSVPAGDVEALLSRSDHIREHLFDVLFIGRFMSGKSTIINALAGKPLMTTKATACNGGHRGCLLWREDNNTVYVYYKDREKPREMTLEEFSKEFQITAEDDMAVESGGRVERFSGVSYAQLHSNNGMFADGVVVIDSPGLEYAGATPLYAEFIPKASAIIFTLSATALFSEKEKQYINMNFTGKHMRNVFFVVNRINQLNGANELEDKVKPLVRQNLEDVFTDENGNFDEALYNSRVFYVDAYGALCASTGQPYKVLAGRHEIEVPITREETGIVPFENALSDFLNSQDRLNAAYRQVLDEMERTFRRVSEFHLSALDKAEAFKDELRRIFSRGGTLVAEELYGETRRFVSVELPARFIQKLNTLSEEEIREIIRGSARYQATLGIFPITLLAPPLSDTAKAFIVDFLDSQVREWFEGMPAKLKEKAEPAEEEAKRLCAAFDKAVNDAVQAICPDWTKADLYMRSVMNVTVYTYVRPMTIADKLSDMGKLAAVGLRVQSPRFSSGPRRILDNAGFTVFRNMEKEFDAQHDDFMKTFMEEFDQAGRHFIEMADRVLEEARAAIRKALDESMGECIDNVMRN